VLRRSRRTRPGSSGRAGHGAGWAGAGGYRPDGRWSSTGRRPDDEWSWAISAANLLLVVGRRGRDLRSVRSWPPSIAIMRRSRLVPGAGAAAGPGRNLEAGPRSPPRARLVDLTRDPRF